MNKEPLNKTQNQIEKELTDIEVVVFETDDGQEIDMLIVDEFELNGKYYVALVESIIDEVVTSESFDVDETIVFCEVVEQGGQESFETIEDSATIALLQDELENRLLEREQN